MIILALTGSMAMGKSHATRMFRALGVPVFDADAAVHALFLPGGAAVEAVARAFEDCRDETGGIDRKRLGRRVFGDDAALRRLEAIVHPRVREAEHAFLRAMCRNGHDLCVLDIPLLFETGGEARADAVAVVSAGRFIQRMRAFRRPGMTEQRFRAITEQQMPDPQKKKRADFVIPSGSDRGLTFRAVSGVLDALRTRRGEAWPHAWLARGRAG